MRRGPALLILALLLLVGGWFWGSAGHGTGYANLPPRARGEWVAFGDSLTEGVGADPGGDYPSQLAQRLGVRIRNLGVSGNTTADALARVEEAVQLEPRVVLLCLGGNDTLRSLPPEQTFAHLATLIDRFHQGGAFVVLLGVRGRRLADEQARGFEQLARDKRVLLVPNILEGVLFTPSLMADPIHPNDQGYARIAERLEKSLLPVLPML